MRHFCLFKSLISYWGLCTTYGATAPFTSHSISVIIKCLFLATLRNLTNQINTNLFSEIMLIPKSDSLKLLLFISPSFEKVSTQPGTKEIINSHGNLRFILNIYGIINENAALRNISPHKHGENTNVKRYNLSLLKINNKDHYFNYSH